jgi:hypothetical protein
VLVKKREEVACGVGFTRGSDEEGTIAQVSMQTQAIRQTQQLNLATSTNQSSDNGQDYNN